MNNEELIGAESTEVETAPVQAEEKYLPQHQVNDIVHRKTSAAYSKGYKQAKEELEAEYASRNQPIATNSSIDEEALYHKMSQRLENERRQKEEEHIRKQQEALAAQTYNTYKQRVGDYVPPEGFDPSEFPEIVFLSTEVDNTREVIEELANNPHKLANIDYLASKRSPASARAAIKKISESLKKNSEGQNAYGNAAKEPLSKLKPSNTVSSGGGRPTIDELRRMPQYRR